MVGVGNNGRKSILARVSIVNNKGECIYDKYVKPEVGVEVTDYRTEVSGVQPHHLRKGIAASEVKREVAELLTGRVLVGHDLRNDLSVLDLRHPRERTRDSAAVQLLRRADGRKDSLKNLASKELGWDIQDGSHSSVEDARAAVMLYKKHKVAWEKELRGGSKDEPDAPITIQPVEAKPKPTAPTDIFKGQKFSDEKKFEPGSLLPVKHAKKSTKKKTGGKGKGKGKGKGRGKGKGKGKGGRGKN